jgi:hypothetical protein
MTDFIMSGGIEMFNDGDTVFHRNLKLYGTFKEINWQSDSEAVVNFIDEDGDIETKIVSLSLLEKVNV